MDGQTRRSSSAEDAGLQPQRVTAGRRTKGNMLEVCVCMSGSPCPRQESQFAITIDALSPVSCPGPCLTWLQLPMEAGGSALPSCTVAEHNRNISAPVRRRSQAASTDAIVCLRFSVQAGGVSSPNPATWFQPAGMSLRFAKQVVEMDETAKNKEYGHLQILCIIFMLLPSLTAIIWPWFWTQRIIVQQVPRLAGLLHNHLLVHTHKWERYSTYESFGNFACHDRALQS